MALWTPPNIFSNVETAEAVKLDQNFDSLKTLVNGNLNEVNVAKAADCIKAGGLSIAATPEASKIIPLSASGKLVTSARPAMATSVYVGGWINEYGPVYRNIKMLQGSWSLSQTGASYARLRASISMTYNNIAAEIAWRAYCGGLIFQFKTALTAAYPTRKMVIDFPYVPVAVDGSILLEFKTENSIITSCDAAIEVPELSCSFWR